MTFTGLLNLIFSIRFINNTKIEHNVMKTEILTRVVMLLISLMGHHYSIAQDKRNDQLIDEMENYLLSAMDEGDIPGLSIVIVDLSLIHI